MDRFSKSYLTAILTILPHGKSLSLEAIARDLLIVTELPSGKTKVTQAWIDELVQQEAHPDMPTDFTRRRKSKGERKTQGWGKLK